MRKIGIYNPYIETKGGGEKLCLSLASVLSESKENEVSVIIHSEIIKDEIANYFNLDLSKISFFVVDFEKPLFKLLHRIPLPGRVKNYFNDFHVVRTVKKSGFDVFINNCYHSNLPNPCRNGVYLCMFPQRITPKSSKNILKKFYYLTTNVLYRITFHPSKKHPVNTYQNVISISEFTQSYVKKYWGVDSKILYPVCENMLDSTKINKKKIILNVGRFFENVGESHHKRQDFLIESFKKMPVLHKDWELHLAGSVAESAGGLKYILSLMKEAQGLPVVFHFNSSFKELRTLFNEALIYWHATGYGSDVSKYPEKQEHFGITTVEAMSTGAIPIVINTAGQKETVTDGENGFLWNDFAELKKSTGRVANMNSAELKLLQESAENTAYKFQIESFKKDCRSIFDEIL